MIIINGIKIEGSGVQNIRVNGNTVTFADGVEEGLSKALLIMNKHRVPEKTGDNE